MTRLLLVGLLLGVAISCGTSEPVSVEDQARAIEREVWSPYCPGRLLIDCTTQQARELRDEIEARLDRGDTQAEVIGWIRRNHGDEALARPEASGAGLALWLVPAAIFAVGAVLVVGLIRRWSRTEVPGEPREKGELDARA